MVALDLAEVASEDVELKERVCGSASTLKAAELEEEMEELLEDDEEEDDEEEEEEEDEELVVLLLVVEVELVVGGM